MNINFTVNDIAFTLNTGSGQLIGDNSPEREWIEKQVAGSIGCILSIPGSPQPSIEIISPYYHADQFAACLLYEDYLHENYIVEGLWEYTPHWTDDEKTEFIKMEANRAVYH